TRPLRRPASVKVEGADDLVSQAHRDPRYASHRQAACGGGELGPPGGLLPYVGNPDHLTGVVGIPARACLLILLISLQLPRRLAHRSHETQPPLLSHRD